MHRYIYVFFVAIGILIFLGGCFKGEQTLGNLNDPNEEKLLDDEGQEDNKKASEENQDVDKEKEKKQEKKDENPAVDETVARELYLIDANGLVASQTLELPKEDTKEVAQQAVEYLVKDGPVNDYLPNGFKAVLPAGTEVIGLNLKDDGTLIVDLSEEFKNYQEDEEVKILEAMTHTLTQFENVKQIQIWINGHPLEEMPVDGTPIGEGYSRSNGINILPTKATGHVNSEVVTMYYPKEYNEQRYYIPFTKHVKTNEENLYVEIVNELIAGPGYETSATEVFNSDTQLKNEPVLEDGILELEFTSGILKDKDADIIADEVIETLVRTLTEQESVEAVKIRVENVETLVNENGEAYNDPVSKYKYMPKEKL